MSEWANDELADEGIEAQTVAVDDEADAAGAEARPTLYYGSVDEFVREYLRHVYRRRIDGRNRVWAARWWEHDEAVIRLEALWRAWEHLRQDPATGMSVWWRDHADHHMAMLMSPEGPFSAADPGAKENQTRKGDSLPYQPPPAALFPDVRTSDDQSN
jgi:hypothetical protein